MSSDVETRVVNFASSLKDLRKGFQGVLSGHQSLSKASKDLKVKLEKIQTCENFPQMRDALSQLIQSLNEIEHQRHVAVVDRMLTAESSTVMSKLADMDESVKVPAQLKLDDVKKRRKNLSKLRGKKVPDTNSIADEEKAYMNAQTAFYKHMKGFEEERLDEEKELLIEYCNSMLFFHCRAIEQLSLAVKKINEVDSQEASKAIAKQIKKEQRELQDV